jgi:hypothetical protein
MAVLVDELQEQLLTRMQLTWCQHQQLIVAEQLQQWVEAESNLLYQSLVAVGFENHHHHSPAADLQQKYLHLKHWCHVSIHQL